MAKEIVGEIFGYVIRHPGEESDMRYIIGDPEKLKRNYYEVFNPVCALVRLDKGRIIDEDKEIEAIP